MSQRFLREAPAVGSKHAVIYAKTTQHNNQGNNSPSNGSNSQYKLTEATLAYPCNAHPNHVNSLAGIRKHETCTTAP